MKQSIFSSLVSKPGMSHSLNCSISSQSLVPMATDMIIRPPDPWVAWTASAVAATKVMMNLLRSWQKGVAMESSSMIFHPRKNVINLPFHPTSGVLT